MPWPKHKGWTFKRGKGLVNFFYISPEGKEYASENAAQRAYDDWKKQQPVGNEDEHEAEEDGDEEEAAAAGKRLKGSPTGSGPKPVAERAGSVSPTAGGSPGVSPARADRAGSAAAAASPVGSVHDESKMLSLATGMSGSFLDDSCVGRQVAVFWPSHVRWYEGDVTGFNKKSRLHSILYTDGLVEWTNLVEHGRFLSDGPAGDEVLRRHHMAEGGSPRLAPSLFAVDGAQAVTLMVPPVGVNAEPGRQRSAGTAEAAASAPVAKRTVPAKTAEKPARRRTGRAVLTPAQIEKQKQQLAKAAAEKKRKIAEELRSVRKAAQKKAAAEATAERKAVAAAKAAAAAAEADEKMISAGTGAVVAPPIVKALLPILSLQQKQRDPILGALAKALRRSKPGTGTYTNIQRVREQLKAKPLGANATKAAVRSMLQSPHSLSAIDGQRVKIFWPGDARWYAASAGPYDADTNLTRIDYDDGETYRHDLSEAAWRVLVQRGPARE